MNSINGPATPRKIDWTYLLLAAFAGIGLVLSIVTVWEAWVQPTWFDPEDWFLGVLGLAHAADNYVWGVVWLTVTLGTAQE
jgi:hypothetical protein